ncbi:MAG: TspO/MBR family protein [Pseudomonadota bacterium]
MVFVRTRGPGSSSRRVTPNFLLWLTIFSLFVLMAALSGAKFAPGEWYDAIAKPDWTPPGWVFPVVWTTLYVFIAIAGTLVFTARTSGKLLPLTIWFAQIAVNGLWSAVFFGMRRIDAALLVVGLLVLLVALFIRYAYRHSPVASILFVPYLAWVSTAFALNLHVWALNGWPLGVFEFPGVQ